MERVGIRKVKAKLSTYLRRVKSGETIVVTERGKPIADLRPHHDEDEDIEAKLNRLAAEGKLRRPRRRLKHPMDAFKGWKGLGKGIDSQKLLDWTREDRAWPASRTSKRAR